MGAIYEPSSWLVRRKSVEEIFLDLKDGNLLAGLTLAGPRFMEIAFLRVVSAFRQLFMRKNSHFPYSVDCPCYSGVVTLVTRSVPVV